MIRQKIVMMISAAAIVGCVGTGAASRVVPEQGYTWGINNQTALTLDSGQIITKAVLTFHNVRSDRIDTTTTTTTEVTRSSFRSGTTTSTTVIETPNFDSLQVYVLDNPRYGFLPLRHMSYSDPFDGFGCRVDGVYEDNNLVYRLGQTHEQDSYFSQVFGDAAQFSLTNGTSVSLSSALLEFIDYAGTGPSVGFGIWPGSVGYDYDDITLELTVQSHMGDYTSYSLVYHIADDMSPVDDQQTPPEEPEIQAYTLNITAANGTVTKSPNQATYSHGQTVTLTATPASGYSFANWTGDASGTSNSVTITMNGDKTVAANFTQNAYTLNITAANGTVTKSPNQATYSHGQTVTLTATPASGYSFANWTGDASGTSNSVTVTMNGNKSVAANFTQNTGSEFYTLSIAASNGSVTAKVNGAVTAATSFAAGTVVELTAEPNTGYTFSGWSGDTSGTSDTILITMNGAASVTANFSATVTRSSFRR